jgi:hypothetical protein
MVPMLCQVFNHTQHSTSTKNQRVLLHQKEPELIARTIGNFQSDPQVLAAALNLFKTTLEAEDAQLPAKDTSLTVELPPSIGSACAAKTVSMPLQMFNHTVLSPSINCQNHIMLQDQEELTARTTGNFLSDHQALTAATHLFKATSEAEDAHHPAKDSSPTVESLISTGSACAARTVKTPPETSNHIQHSPFIKRTTGRTSKRKTLKNLMSS